MSPINPPGRWGQERAARQGRPQPLGAATTVRGVQGVGGLYNHQNRRYNHGYANQTNIYCTVCKNMYYHIVLDFLIIVFNFFKFFVRFPFLF